MRSVVRRVVHRGARFALDVNAARAAAPSTEFARLFFAHDGRGVRKWVHYFEVYERHFDAYRDGFPLPGGGYRPLRFLEIGVSEGGSLQLWRKYFGSDATIFGVDIDARCAVFDNEGAHVRIGSQADPPFLLSVVKEMGGVDVVLDDGSHRAKDQRVSFDTLFPLLSYGGLYIVEDLHTAYWPRMYQGGYRRPGTFIELSKSLVDGMHSWYHRWPQSRRNRLAKIDVGSVCFYASIVVIEKRHRDRPGHVRTGTPFS